MLFPNIEEVATTSVVTVSATDTVRTAIERMSARNIRDVVVVGGKERKPGIFAAVDLIRQHINNNEIDKPLYEVGYRELPTVMAGTNVIDALHHFGDDEDYIGVTDADGELLGIVSYTDLARDIDPKVLVERQSIGDLVRNHGIKVVGVGARLDDALSMLDRPSDSVIIMRGNIPAGILTTKDAIRLIGSTAPLAEAVENFMSAPLETVESTLSIREAVDYLSSKHFKRLVVYSRNDGLLGVLTQHELVAVAYRKWFDLMRNHTHQLRTFTEFLERKATHS